MSKESKYWHSDLKKDVLIDLESILEYASYKARLCLVSELQNIRESLSISQETLSERLGIELSELKSAESLDIEENKSLDIDLVVRYLAALGYEITFDLKPLGELNQNAEKRVFDKRSNGADFQKFKKLLNRESSLKKPNN